MIIVYGEILVDTFPSNKGREVYVGGAPFNMSVAATSMGRQVLFHGNIGNDEYGKKIQEYFLSHNLDDSGLRVDPKRKTTASEVVLHHGEREFTFLRDDTADDVFDEDSLDDIASGDIVHLGSLMLSSERGRKFFHEVIDYAKAQKKVLSFDINFRSDIFKNKEEALAVYNEVYPKMDIVKFSEEELALFTGEKKVEDALPKLLPGPKMILVTLGSRGSLAYTNHHIVRVPSVPVHVVDTTGAGDCFYGTFLSQVDSFGLQELSFLPSLLESTLRFSNIAGALATTKKGALSGIPTYKEVERYLEEHPKK